MIFIKFTLILSLFLIHIPFYASELKSLEEEVIESFQNENSNLLKKIKETILKTCDLLRKTDGADFLRISRKHSEYQAQIESLFHKIALWGEGLTQENQLSKLVFQIADLAKIRKLVQEEYDYISKTVTISKFKR